MSLDRLSQIIPMHRDDPETGVHTDSARQFARAHEAGDWRSMLVGRSPAMREIHRLVERFGPSDRPVLIQGPSGSGKEVVARAIYLANPCRRGEFVDVNCAAISASLVDSELFGHERGAFTGADRRRDGLLARACDGVLFLDEIADLPLDTQARLLRAIESRSFRPLGSDTSVPFRGRIIAASHHSLARLVEAGRFREDLYYRLAVLMVHIPGLRDRPEDLPPLTHHFLAMQARRLRLSIGAIRALSEHTWRGNARELRNLVDRMAVLVDGDTIEESDVYDLLEIDHQDKEALPDEDSQDMDAFGRQPCHDDEPGTDPPLREIAELILRTARGDKLRAIEDALVRSAIEGSANKTAAARLLGCHRKVIERRLGRVRFASVTDAG